MSLGGRIEIDVVPNLDGFDSDLRNQLEGTSSAAASAGKAIGVALAAGAAIVAVGFKQAIDLGIEFQGNLNQIQAVAHATDAQMAQVSATATRLGADLSLPATSASDAAEAMLELAKGGLTVDQAMTAAKGTLQLAAAAQISGAEAATIQSNALNAFGLSAGQAGHVADVLANSANAASGEISDFAQAMQQVGAVAHQFGISLDDTSTALALFANAGIKGSDAGTLLKSSLLALANPSKPAQRAMETLGLTAFDTTGKFVGLESIFDQLRGASQRLTPELFNQASAAVFGSDAVRLAGVAAGTAAGQWDTMSAAISRSGGAQEVAAAQMKGLGGAIQGLNSQLETSQLQVFDAIQKPLEAAVRAATELVPRIGDGISSGLRVIVAVGETVGPALAQGISAGAADAAAAGEALIGPFINAVTTGIGIAVSTGVAIFGDYVNAAKNVVSALAPVASGIGAVADAATRGDGALSAVAGTVKIVGAAASGLSAVLVPIGAVVGTLVAGFASLPGPIQTVVIAMLALKFAGPLLSSLASGFNNVRTSGTLFGTAVNALTAPVRAMSSGFTAGTGALRQFGGEMSVQRSLAAGAGESIGTLGAAQAAFRTSTLSSVSAARGFTEQVSAIRAGAAASGQSVSAFSASMGALGERVPVLTQMGAAFQNAAGSVGRFGTAAGIASAAGVGLKNLGTGLIGALGGPFGAAITAAVIGIGLFSAANAKSKAEVEAHKAAVSSLADALKQTEGAFTGLAREQLVSSDEFKTAGAAVAQFGIGLNDLLDAATTGGAPLEAIRAKLQGIVDANTQLVPTGKAGGTRQFLNETGQAAQDALKSLEPLVGTVQGAKQSYDDFNTALGKTGASLTQGAQAGSTLKSALDTLGDAAKSADDKTRALNDALNALSGGQLGLEQANSRLNESLGGLGDKFQGAADAAKNAGTSLLDASGAINTTTIGGQELLRATTDLQTSMTQTAQAAFEANGGFGNLAQSTAAARDAAQRTHDAFVQNAQQMGLTAVQAEALAARYGLIPDTVTTLITAQGLDQAGQELLQLKQQFDEFPDKKSVVVESLSADAQTKLTELGFTLEAIPGTKQVIVTAPTDEAKANLGEFLALANGSIAIIKMDADPNPATGKINATVQLGNGQTATMTFDAKPDPATGKINATVDLGNGKTATMQFDANSQSADGTIQATVDLGNGKTATIKVLANDLASAIIDKAARPRTAVITILAEGPGSVRHVTGTQDPGLQAKGGILSPMHDGGVLGFANGGTATRKLTKMRGGIASIVPPNTWRIVGDRIVDDEAYIPINRSQRSQRIFEETARRMGYAVARRFADGGFSDAAKSVIRGSVVRATSASSPDVVAAIGVLARRIDNLGQSIQNSVGATINVEDRSGNPLETARAVQLKLRSGLR